MAPLGLFGSFGFQELLLILLIVVVLFGARKIPELARGLGEGIRGFRAALKGEEPGGAAPKPGDEDANSPSQR